MKVGYYPYRRYYKDKRLLQSNRRSIEGFKRCIKREIEGTEKHLKFGQALVGWRKYLKNQTDHWIEALLCVIQQEKQDRKNRLIANQERIKRAAEVAKIVSGIPPNFIQIDPDQIG